MENQHKDTWTSLKGHAWGLIILLIIEYVLGMAANLFIHFPESGTPKEFWDFSQNQMPLVLHIIVGFLLILGSIALVVRSILSHNKIWQKASIISLIGVFGAWISGVLFISSQSDSYSFLMSIGFIISLLSLGWGVYSSKNS